MAPDVHCTELSKNLHRETVIAVPAHALFIPDARVDIYDVVIGANKRTSELRWLIR